MNNARTPGARARVCVCVANPKRERALYVIQFRLFDVYTLHTFLPAGAASSSTPCNLYNVVSAAASICSTCLLFENALQLIESKLIFYLLYFIP